MCRKYQKWNIIYRNLWDRAVIFSEENSQPTLLILKNKEFFQVEKSKDSK